MTQYVINIGAMPNDGTGDPLRTAFNETNLNFDQIFAAGPVLSNVRIANNSILTQNTNGNLVLAPNGIGVVQSNQHIIPNIGNVRNLGSPDRRWATIYTQYANIVTATIENANIANVGNLTIPVANLHILGGSNGYVLQTDGLGNLTWTAQTGGSGNGTPGGANTQIQFNDAGSFGGSPNLTYNQANNVLTVNGAMTALDATVYGNLAAITGVFSGNVYAEAYYLGGTPLTRTLTVGRAVSPVTIPLATNNSFNVLTDSGNVTVYTT